MSNNPSLGLAARARWQKWEMDNLNSQRKIATKIAPKQDIIKAAKLKQEQAKLFATASQTGYDEGHKKGYAIGYETGLEQGTQTGIEQGYENGLQNGHQEGYAAGLAEGKAAGTEQINEIINQLQTLISGFNKTLDSLEQDIGQSVIGLSIDIARKIIHSQLKDHPELINAVIQRVIETNIEQKTDLKIHLNPADIELVKQHWNVDAKQQFKLIEQADISPGGCVIDTEHGSIDATLETRWLRIIGALGYADAY